MHYFTAKDVLLLLASCMNHKVNWLTTVTINDYHHQLFNFYSVKFVSEHFIIYVQYEIT